MYEIEIFNTRFAGQFEYKKSFDSDQQAIQWALAESKNQDIIVDWVKVTRIDAYEGRVSVLDEEIAI